MTVNWLSYLESSPYRIEIPFQEEQRFPGKPAWLDLFLSKTFFDFCSVHDLCKNDRNRYCVNCDLAVCQYCIASGSHIGHNILKLYRHVYKDVVPVSDMENYIDCSNIQVRDQNKLLERKSSNFILYLLMLQNLRNVETFYLLLWSSYLTWKTKLGRKST